MNLLNNYNTGDNKSSCDKFTYRQIYDNYTNFSFFGGLGNEPLFTYMDNQERASRVDEGYIVNKPLDRILKWQYPLNRLLWRVLDHIRICEEVMSGIFTTPNEEFRLVMYRFLKEFMFGHVYVIYDEAFTQYELDTVKRLAKENNEDVYERIQKSYPLSNFRLLKRVPYENGKYRWDCLLSNVQQIEIPDSFQPQRFSFNEGFMFIRLYEIFNEFESQMQIFKKLFMGVSTLGDISAEDINQCYTKVAQVVSPEVYGMSVNGEATGETTITDMKLFDKTPNLVELYQLIKMELLDRLGELGLAVDDTNKRERITVGENIRASQPTVTFQNTIMERLKNVTYTLSKVFNIDVQFNNLSEQSEQRMGAMNKSKFDKYDKS